MPEPLLSFDQGVQERAYALLCRLGFGSDGKGNRLFVKSGFVSPAEHATAEAERQWRLAIDVCVAATRIYVAAGVRCAIDTLLLPFHLELWSGLAHLRVGLVVLHPAAEVAVARNAARVQQTGWGVPEWQVRANHEAMGAWYGRPEAFVLDTSRMDRTQVVAALDDWEGSIGDRGGRGCVWYPA